MRAFAAFVPTAGEDLVDTAGTGGGRTTFNVSTTAALIAAAAAAAWSPNMAAAPQPDSRAPLTC